MKPLKLYDYPEAFAAIDAAIDAANGELTPEVEAELDALSASWDTKLAGCCALAKNYSKTAEALREEAQRIAQKAASAERTAERIKSRIKATLEAMGLAKTESFPFKVRIQRNSRPSIGLQRGIEIDSIPPELVRVVKELDKDAALAYWNGGPEKREVAEFLLAVDYGTHLRID